MANAVARFFSRRRKRLRRAWWPVGGWFSKEIARLLVSL
jgi:hypothetical protein